MLSGKFGSGNAFVLAHLNPVIVPITMMRDFILGSTSGSLTMVFAMFGGLFFLSFIRNNGVQEKGAQNGGGVVKVLKLDEIELTDTRSLVLRKEGDGTITYRTNFA